MLNYSIRLAAAAAIICISNTIFAQTVISPEVAPGDTYNKASELFNEKKYAEAEQLFSEIIEQGTEEHNTYFRRSYCYYYLGQYNKSLTDIERAFELAPKDHRYFYLKAQSYDKLKNTDMANYYLDMAILFEPGKLYYYKYRSAFLLETGDYKKAEYDFNVLIGENPMDYNSYYGRGLARYNQKRKTEACLDWQYAKEKNKSSNRFFFYKCTDLNLNGKTTAPTSKTLPIPPVFKSEYHSNFNEYLTKKIKYSIDAYNQELECYCMAKFIVSANKTIEDIQIISSTNLNFNNSIAEAIKSSQKYWIESATIYNTPVAYTFYVPVRFKLKLKTASIHQLQDSLKLYQKEGNLQNTYSVANKILNQNPFLPKVAAIHTKATKELGKNERSYLINDLKYLKNNKSEILDEIWISPHFHKTYYNALWQISSKNSSEYTRISNWRVFVNNRSNDNTSAPFTIIDYRKGPFWDYNKSGNLYCSGRYKQDKKYGKFNFYFANGNLQSRMYFKEDQIVDSVLYFHKSGLPNQTITINNGNFNIVKYYDENGNDLLTNGNGFWEFSKPDFSNANNLDIKGYYKDYKRDGEWILYFGGDIFVEEKYKNGKFVNGKYYKDGKSKSTAIKADKSYIGSWIFMPVSLTRAEKPEIASDYTASKRTN
ncbi:tetratricopeptide repeat protein [Labilibacter sediminis]|nr:tetratricopeptide repeat protein [Labilibacter sediminis]